MLCCVMLYVVLCGVVCYFVCDVACMYVCVVCNCVVCIVCCVCFGVCCMHVRVTGSGVSLLMHKSSELNDLRVSI